VQDQTPITNRIDHGAPFGTSEGTKYHSPLASEFSCCREIQNPRASTTLLLCAFTLASLARLTVPFSGSSLLTTLRNRQELLYIALPKLKFCFTAFQLRKLRDAMLSV